MPTFTEFLHTRRITDTPRGDFIRDARGDRWWPNPSSWLDLESYLRQSPHGHACLDAIREAQRLWREYERFKRGS